MLRLPIGSRRSYCRSCGRYFVSTAAFDQHRQGGVCLNPATVGLALRGYIWGWPPSSSWNPELEASGGAEDGGGHNGIIMRTKSGTQRPRGLSDEKLPAVFHAI
jgi:hypothetical protein